VSLKDESAAQPPLDGDSDAGQDLARGRVREYFRSNPVLNDIWRIGVLLVGSALVIVGFAMLVLPGPGLAGIAVGLVVLASEFDWARRALVPVRRAVDKAKAASNDPAKQRRNLILSVLGGVLAAGFLGWYLWHFGVTLAPVIDFLGLV
jgi:uncharacterized protein (TIGR02611 family)